MKKVKKKELIKYNNNIIKMYYDNKSTGEIAYIYNTWPEYIRQILIENNVVLRNISESQVIRFKNSFPVLSADKWGGILYFHQDIIPSLSDNDVDMSSRRREFIGIG